MSDKPPPHERLTRYLLVKAAAELVFVAALAAAFYLTALRAPFTAEVSADAGARAVSGRVLDASHPDTRPELHLYIDGRHVETLPPERAPRGHEAARDEGHPFTFRLPPLDPGEHEARVYAAREGARGGRRTLRLLGGPLRLPSE